ncbi:hypothetical protein ANCDUO_24423 [Ancylostoma duodenale]|uniref:Uncharacterized protein n=1 Tax=Ancylostoma duodenale TaxID=51022 RepID=A0A0C2FKZ7_9BILA|nr:hypothetical protein ANCDUO_24423 [Ancylostoma duodenale]
MLTFPSIIVNKSITRGIPGKTMETMKFTQTCSIFILLEDRPDQCVDAAVIRTPPTRTRLNTINKEVALKGARQALFNSSSFVYNGNAHFSPKNLSLLLFPNLLDKYPIGQDIMRVESNE